MACLKPNHAYKSSLVSKTTGKNKVIVVDTDEAYKLIAKGVDVFPVRCGQCIGCRLDNAREWATKMMCEYQLHDESIFLTLTYDDEHLPEDGSLHPEHLSSFIKNLRRQIEYHQGDIKIRFYGCGEYGDQYSRPHFHVIIFGWRPSDGRRYSDKLYTSRFIEKIWKRGWCPYGNVTFESCAYVARYVTKKVTGKMADFYYDGLEPEFARMSRRPGIGKGFFEKYQSQLIRDDYIVVRDGIKVPLPRYFNKIFEEYYPSKYEEIKSQRNEQRERKFHADVYDNYDFVKYRKELNPDFDVTSFDSDKLRSLEQDFYEFHINPIKEEVLVGKQKLLKRGYENGDS